MATAAQQRAAMEAGDMDDLLPPSQHGSTSVTVGARPDPVSKFAHNLLSCVATVYAFTMYHYLNHRTEFVLACILIVCSFIAVVDISEHRRAKRAIYNPKIQHDWTHIESAMDLKLGNVDHWCLKGGDSSCTCEDPLVPSTRSETRGWGSAHRHNVETIREALAREVEQYEEDEDGSPGAESGNEGSNANWWEDSPEYVDDWSGYEYGQYGGAREPQPGDPDYDSAFFDRSEFDLDVAFIGDSITEQRVGKNMGKEQPTLKANAKTFQKTYSKANGGKLDGIGLGVAGDTSPVLLWRLLHGEMPPDFNPRVWWINIGTNDLLRTRCSEEVTLMGILRIVEEILREKQDATVVINSILPLSLDPNGLLQSSKRKPKGSRFINLWPSIQLLNGQLKKFADRHKRVKFFDATEIFINRKGGEVLLDQTLYLDGLHPNAAGYKAWDEHIIKRLEAIVRKKDEKEREEKNKEKHDTSKDEDEIEEEIREEYWDEAQDDMAFLYNEWDDDVWAEQGEDGWDY